MYMPEDDWNYGMLFILLMLLYIIVNMVLQTNFTLR